MTVSVHYLRFQCVTNFGLSLAFRHFSLPLHPHSEKEWLRTEVVNHTLDEIAKEALKKHDDTIDPNQVN